jgi:hypothetical protein
VLARIGPRVEPMRYGGESDDAPQEPKTAPKAASAGVKTTTNASGISPTALEVSQLRARTVAARAEAADGSFGDRQGSSRRFPTSPRYSRAADGFRHRGARSRRRGRPGEEHFHPAARQRCGVHGGARRRHSRRVQLGDAGVHQVHEALCCQLRRAAGQAERRRGGVDGDVPGWARLLRPLPRQALLERQTTRPAVSSMRGWGRCGRRCLPTPLPRTA